MRRKGNVSFEEGSPNFSSEFALGYFYRGVKEELNSISAASGGEILAHELAGRLAALLLAEESRSELGPEHLVSSVRKQATKRSKAVAKVALVGRPRGSKTSLKKKKSGIKLWWSRMTPEERRNEVRRRQGLKAA